MVFPVKSFKPKASSARPTFKCTKMDHVAINLKILLLLLFLQGISEASVKVGAVYKYDLSIPVEKLYDIVEEMRCRLGNCKT